MASPVEIEKYETRAYKKRFIISEDLTGIDGSVSPVDLSKRKDVYTSLTKYFKLQPASLHVGVKKNKNGIYTKDIVPLRDWETRKPELRLQDPQDREYYNAWQYRCGNLDNVNNISVVDIDDLESPEAKDLIKMCETASLIVKTRKGYHFYFAYEPRIIVDGKMCKETLGFSCDVQSSSRLCVVAPPSRYKMGDLTITYQVIRMQLNSSTEPFKRMSNELIEYLLDHYNTTTLKSSISASSSSSSTAYKQAVEDKRLNSGYSMPTTFSTGEEDIMYHLLDGLAPKRSTTYTEWQTLAYCLHNSNIKFDIFDHISRKYYTGYNQEECRRYYNSLVTRPADKRKLTVATLWQWLKQDNKGLYTELTKRQREMENTINPTTPEEEQELILELDPNVNIFIHKKLLELIAQDVEAFPDGRYLELFSRTRSYQYFSLYFAYAPLEKKIVMFGTKIQYLAIDFLQNAFIGTKNKKVPFIKLWLQSKSTRQIYNVEFEPNLAKFNTLVNKDQILNLYTGFKYDNILNDGKYVEEVVRPFLEHIYRICNNNDVAVYFLNLISHIIQNPHILTEVCCVFYSNTHGAGKNIIFDILALIFDKYFLKFGSSADIARHFNGHFMGKLLGLCDEVDATCKAVENELKDIITRKKTAIEFKGVDPFMVNNYMNLFVTTNNEKIFNLPPTDRRIFIIDCREERMTKANAIELVNLQKDEDKLRQIYNFFKTRDIANFDPSEIVVTDYKVSLILNALPPHLSMFRDNPMRFENNTIASKALYTMAVEYAKDIKARNDFTDRRVYMDLIKVFPADWKTKNSLTGINAYTFPDNFSSIIDNLLEKYVRDNQSRK